MLRCAFVFGGLFGLIAPAIGLFAGLQLSSLMANILLAPFWVVGRILGQPLGEFSSTLLVTCTFLSVIFWGLGGVAISRIVRATSAGT